MNDEVKKTWTDIARYVILDEMKQADTNVLPLLSNLSNQLWKASFRKSFPEAMYPTETIIRQAFIDAQEMVRPWLTQDGMIDLMAELQSTRIGYHRATIEAEFRVQRQFVIGGDLLDAKYATTIYDKAVDRRTANAPTLQDQIASIDTGSETEETLNGIIERRDAEIVDLQNQLRSVKAELVERERMLNAERAKRAHVERIITDFNDVCERMSRYVD